MLQDGPTAVELRQFQDARAIFVRNIFKNACILLYRNDLRKQRFSERSISSRATWTERMVAQSGVQETQDIMRHRLLHNGDVLEETRLIWNELTSKFIGENDLWLLKFWLRDGALPFDRRKQAFQMGLDKIHSCIQDEYGFQAAHRMRTAVAKSAYGVGDTLPFLVYTLLDPESKADLMEFSMHGLPTAGGCEHHGPPEVDFYACPRGSGD